MTGRGTSAFARGVALAAMLFAGLCSPAVGQTAASPGAAPVPALREAAPLGTWAVILSDNLRKSPLEDQVLMGLSREAGLKLVDRSRLDLLVKEMAVAGLAETAATADRAKAGRILKADALAIISRESVEGKEFIRLTISECRTGARLRVDWLPLAEDRMAEAAATLVADIRRTREQFTEGVTQVFGVPPFVSRCLTHQYDYLQRGYAELLATGLGAQKGVAVIEVEEARQIAREIVLTDGADVKRLVPMFVEGEFEVTRAETAKEEPTISFRFKVSGTGVKERAWSERPMKLSAAPTFVGRDLAALVTGLRQPAAGAGGLSADRQAATLIARADAFAALGTWEHSTALREAALLLKDDPVQRDKVIQEYGRIINANWPEGTMSGSPAQLAGCRCRIELWRIGLAHAEYLVRNRQATLPQATGLAGMLMDRIKTACFSMSIDQIPDLLADMEQTKRRFVREVYPLMLGLEHRSPYDSGRQDELWTWGEGLVGFAVDDYRGRLRSDTLDFVASVATEDLPADFRPPFALVRLVGYKREIPGLSAEQADAAWDAFLERLIRSDRPAASLPARFGKAYHTLMFHRPTADLPALLSEVEQAIKDYNAQSPRMRGHSGSSLLADCLKDLKGSVERAVNPPPATEYRPTPPDKYPDPFTYEALDLKVRTLAGEMVPMKGRSWRCPGGWWGITNYLPCGPGLDLLWQGGAVVALREKGLAEEVLVDRDAWFCDVAWDGRNVWVATRTAGLWVVSLEGKVIARIGEADGLPAAEQGFCLQSISPGKVLAAGALGPHQRLWLAVVEHDAGKAKVNVFHQATRVLAVGEDSSKVEPSVDWAGAPQWTHELQRGDKGGPRTVLVGWGWQRRPLQVDLDTLKVSLYDATVSRGNRAAGWCYYSRNGRLYEMSDRGYILPCGDKLYGSAVGVWYLFDWETGRARQVGRPAPGMDARRFGVSAHYGLVGWTGDGQFYRLALKPVASPAAAGPDGAAVATVGKEELAARIKVAREANEKRAIEILLHDGQGRHQLYGFTRFLPKPVPDYHLLSDEEGRKLLDALIESGFFERALALDMADPQYPRRTISIRVHTGKGFYEAEIGWDRSTVQLLEKMRAAVKDGTEAAKAMDAMLDKVR